MRLRYTLGIALLILVIIVNCGRQVRCLGHGRRMCLDAAVGRHETKKPVIAYPCHGQGGNQVLAGLWRPWGPLKKRVPIARDLHIPGRMTLGYNPCEKKKKSAGMCRLQGWGRCFITILTMCRCATEAPANRRIVSMRPSMRTNTSSRSARIRATDRVATRQDIGSRLVDSAYKLTFDDSPWPDRFFQMCRSCSLASTSMNGRMRVVVTWSLVFWGSQHTTCRRPLTHTHAHAHSLTHLFKM